MAEQSEALDAYVRNLLPAARRIILDLKEVARMDSSGLGTVVGLYISAHKSGGELILINYKQVGQGPPQNNACALRVRKLRAFRRALP